VRTIGGVRRMLLVALAACGACTDPEADPMHEVAAELRALRVAMRAPAAGAANAPTLDREQFGAALAPLREALEALVANQQQLHAKQLALTQELQRWSQLVAQVATGTARAESEALEQRLRALEQELKAQDARHREVEGLLGGALERTADRIDALLKRLQGQAEQTPAATPDSPKDSNPVPAPAAQPGAGAPRATGGTLPGGDDAVGLGPRTRRQAMSGWWIGLLAAAVAVGAGFAWRLRRTAVAAGGAGPASEPAPAAQPAFDHGVEEIWAAAALLGEAVDRLRETGGLPEAGSVVEPAGEAATEEAFVLDEGIPAGCAAPEGRPAEPSPERDVVAAAAPPEEVVLRLRVADAASAGARVLRTLGGDPRVLRRPGPSVVAADQGLTLRFSVVPGLPSAERAELERQLRSPQA